MQRRYLLGVLSLSVTLASCQLAQRQGYAVPSTSKITVIKLAYEPPETCRVTVDGQSFTLPSDEPELTAALKLQATRYRTARVDAVMTIPYKCVGYAVFVAQRAGFKRASFIAAPPPPTKP